MESLVSKYIYVVSNSVLGNGASPVGGGGGVGVGRGYWTSVEVGIGVVFVWSLLADTRCVQVSKMSCLVPLAGQVLL